VSRGRAALAAVLGALAAEIVVLGAVIAGAPDEGCESGFDGAPLPAATWPVIITACVVGVIASIVTATERPAQLAEDGRRMRRRVVGLTVLIVVGAVAAVVYSWTVYACWE
jgi:hypothetical protein